MRKLLLLLPAACLFLSSCGVAIPAMRPKSKINLLDLGMKKAEIVSTLGQPDEIRLNKMVNPDKKVTVFEYRLYGNWDFLSNLLYSPITLGVSLFIPITSPEAYWVCVVNDKLTQWGKSEDGWLTLSDLEGEQNINLQIDKE